MTEREGDRAADGIAAALAGGVMGERIEWEEIERALIGFPGGIHARLLAALEAGEAMADLMDEWRTRHVHQHPTCTCRYTMDFLKAIERWRRCVAPRGEVRDARPL